MMCVGRTESSLPNNVHHLLPNSSPNTVLVPYSIMPSATATLSLCVAVLATVTAATALPPPPLPQSIAVAVDASSTAATAPLPSTIGTGMSQAKLTDDETTLFEHTVSADGQWAYLNHFWAAGGPVGQIDRTIFRYYVDNETIPSVVFTPAFACGVGFGDQSAPWQSKWIGKGAKSTGWNHNIPVPFYKSIRVTFQSGEADRGKKAATIWAIVRGSEGLPLRLGNLDLPLAGGKVKLDLQVRGNGGDVLQVRAGILLIRGKHWSRPPYGSWIIHSQ